MLPQYGVVELWTVDFRGPNFKSTGGRYARESEAHSGSRYGSDPEELKCCEQIEIRQVNIPYPRIMRCRRQIPIQKPVTSFP